MVAEVVRQLLDNLLVICLSGRFVNHRLCSVLWNVTVSWRVPLGDPAMVRARSSAGRTRGGIRAIATQRAVAGYYTFVGSNCFGVRFLWRSGMVNIDTVINPVKRTVGRYGCAVTGWPDFFRSTFNLGARIGVLISIRV